MPGKEAKGQETERTGDSEIPISFHTITRDFNLHDHIKWWFSDGVSLLDKYMRPCARGQSEQQSSGVPTVYSQDGKGTTCLKAHNRTFHP